MPRASGRNFRLYQDQCLILCVVELARRGLLEPGVRTGRAELLAPGDAIGGFSVAIRSCFGAFEGILRLNDPQEGEIRAQPVETPIGRRWRLVCPECEVAVKRLYLPESPPGIVPWWACRHCWNLLYRPGQGRGLRSVKKRLAQVQQMKADLARVEAVILVDLDELRARAARAPSPARVI